MDWEHLNANSNLLAANQRDRANRQQQEANRNLAENNRLLQSIQADEENKAKGAKILMEMIEQIGEFREFDKVKPIATGVTLRAVNEIGLRENARDISPWRDYYHFLPSSSSGAVDWLKSLFGSSMELHKEFSTIRKDLLEWHRDPDVNWELVELMIEFAGKYRSQLPREKFGQRIASYLQNQNQSIRFPASKEFVALENEFSSRLKEHGFTAHDLIKSKEGEVLPESLSLICNGYYLITSTGGFPVDYQASSAEFCIDCEIVEEWKPLFLFESNGELLRLESLNEETVIERLYIRPSDSNYVWQNYQLGWSFEEAKEDPIKKKAEAAWKKHRIQKKKQQANSEAFGTVLMWIIGIAIVILILSSQ